MTPPRPTYPPTSRAVGAPASAAHRTRRRMRWILCLEAFVFVLAALVHAGVLVAGDEHAAARNAETVIMAVLLAGALLAWWRPAWQRGAALAAQGFALLGVLVGLWMVAIGVGPRTLPDAVNHVAVALLLAWGLRSAWRSGRAAAP